MCLSVYRGLPLYFVSGAIILMLIVLSEICNRLVQLVTLARLGGNGVSRVTCTRLCFEFRLLLVVYDWVS